MPYSLHSSPYPKQASRQHQQPDCRCFVQTVQLTPPNPHRGDAYQTAQMSPSSRGFKDSSLKPSSTALSAGEHLSGSFPVPLNIHHQHQNPPIPTPQTPAHLVTPFLPIGHAVCLSKPCKTAKIHFLNQNFSLKFQLKHLNILKQECKAILCNIRHFSENIL